VRDVTRIPTRIPLTVAREAHRLAQQLQGDLLNEAGGSALRVLRGVPDDRLEQVMATPLRRVVLDTVFWGLPRALDGTPAGEIVSTVRWHVTGPGDGRLDVYWLELANGQWRSRRGAGDTVPELTLTVDSVELLRLATGRSALVPSYLSGKLRASGNPLLITRVAALARTILAPAAAARPQ
jgi:alkyl sulfatase BDS1-like metallo-beta-lactamase superfamily hydrolase